MTKQHFIELANQIRDAVGTSAQFSPEQIQLLARFCQGQNQRFNARRWLGFIEGECGPNGGEIAKLPPIKT